jgi:hypothetical protein
MPRISTFHGLVIYMCFDDHNPSVHAQYGEHMARIVIESLARWMTSVRGPLYGWPKNGTLHLDELIAKWDRAERDCLDRTEPLP